jgi:CubicO group peptidase (beta-lactamase class C family)/formylglycine-generating enzyme required for sulfatase activity
MRTKIGLLLTLLVLLAATAACDGQATPQPTALPQPTSTREQTTIPRPTPEPTTPEPPQAPERITFPYAKPESVGILSEALEQLSDTVRGYFEKDMIVGAELVVIKNRQIVLHEAIGWQDREEQAPMERNTLFNIRSMTKPVVGTAIQMLIDEGKLALDDRAAEYLPAFDNEQSGDITIEQLLTHRSGLPYSLATGDDLATKYWEYASIQEIAQQAGEHGPDSEPGTTFFYSDVGADTLGAILEEVSGVTIDTFLEERILGPLSMTDTITLIEEPDPRTSRIASAYDGIPGAWERYWSPNDEPIYRFAMGSQSLYSTPIDYARFLTLWMDGGTVGQARLLSPQAVERALAPTSLMGPSINFPGLWTYYGQMWTVYVPADEPDRIEPVVFGHSGVDGTWAWAWPDQDLMILYFTQSRGQSTGLRLEREIDRLLIHPRAEAEATEVPEEFEPYLGPYTVYSGPLENQQISVVVQDGHLALDIASLIVYELQPPDDVGIWHSSFGEMIAVSFDRDDAGVVIGMKIYTDGDISESWKGTAPPLPTETPLPPTPIPVSPIATLIPPGPHAPGDIWVRPTDGMAMVYVPAGEFRMGSTDAEIDALLAECPQCGRERFEQEQPAHSVYLDAFWVDQTEVTNSEYDKCVAAEACSPPPGCSWGESTFGDADKADHPVVCVDWQRAVDYCTWAGGQLPTEAQWEKAARGPDGRRYPWGDEFDGTLLNYCDAQCEHDQSDPTYDDGFPVTAPVGSYPAGASPYGALDMAGNVWEWVADWFSGDYYAVSPVENPQGPDEGSHRVVRGGSWFTDSMGSRVANRFDTDSVTYYSLLGFRCVLATGE